MTDTQTRYRDGLFIRADRWDAEEFESGRRFLVFGNDYDDPDSEVEWRPQYLGVADTEGEASKLIDAHMETKPPSSYLIDPQPPGPDCKLDPTDGRCIFHSLEYVPLYHRPVAE